MKKSDKAKMILFIIIFILLISLAIYAIVSSKSEREYYQSTGHVAATLAPFGTPQPDSGSVPAAPPVVVVQTPAPTPEPTPQPTPTPTPEPTPMPTPTPQPAGMQLSSGSFSSDTPYKLNIRLDYKAYVADDSHVMVDVSVYALHFTFHYNSYPNLILKCGDQTQTVESATINTDDNGLQETLLGSCSFTVDLPANQSVQLPISADWRYNGTYGKDADGNPINIDVLSCGGYAGLAR